MSHARSLGPAGYGIALLRAVVGIVFVAHGAQKLFTLGIGGLAGFFAQIGIPFPAASAALVTGVELLGGLALVLGLFTRVAAVPLAVTMLVAILAVHLPAGFFLPDGYEFPLVLLAATAGLALTGPGALALDNVLFRGRAALVLQSGGGAKREEERAAA